MPGVELRRAVDRGGSLVTADLAREVPFVPRSYFALRLNARIRCIQLMVLLSGAVTALVDNARERSAVRRCTRRGNPHPAWNLGWTSWLREGALHLGCSRRSRMMPQTSSTTMENSSDDLANDAGIFSKRLRRGTGGGRDRVPFLPEMSRGTPARYHPAAIVPDYAPVAKPLMCSAFEFAIFWCIPCSHDRRTPCGGQS